MQRRVSMNDVVKPGQRVAPEDLGQVRFAMSRLGLFDSARDPSGEESLMGGGLRRALGAFQAGQGLREDSTLRPGGPTEQRLNLLLEQNRGLRLADQGDALAPERQAARERTPGTLVARVGPGLENHPDDVAAVSAVLRRLGILKPGTPNPNKTGPVFGGLMSFQRQTGLARDATITPGGPTVRGLAENLLISFQQDPAIRAQLAQLERSIPPVPRRKPDFDDVASDQIPPIPRRKPLPNEPAPERLPPVPRRKPDPGRSSSGRVPPAPRRKPGTGEPLPELPQPGRQSVPTASTADPNLGGVEPELNLGKSLAGVATIVTPALLAKLGLANSAGAASVLLGSGSAAALATLLPASLLAFMTNAFGNNTEPGFGQNPIGP